MEVAAELFLRQGYEKTPVAQILERAEVGAGSFYYYFESKEALLMAVLERYQQILPEVFEKPAREATRDPVEQIFEILAVYRRYLLDYEFQLGCPVGNIALEVGSLIPDVQQKTALLFELWRGMIRRCLEAAVERLPARADREELAALVLSVMEGGVMQARAARDVAPFDASVRQLRNYFNLLTAIQQVDDAAGSR